MRFAGSMHEMEEELPVPLRTGQAGVYDADRHGIPGPRRLDHRDEHSPSHLGIADDPFRDLAAPRLELGLDEDASTGGSAFVAEMNETSQTISSGANGSSVSERALTRSSTMTRGSDRSRGCSCP